MLLSDSRYFLTSAPRLVGILPAQPILGTLNPSRIASLRQLSATRRRCKPTISVMWSIWVILSLHCVSVGQGFDFQALMVSIWLNKTSITSSTSLPSAIAMSLKSKTCIGHVLLQFWRTWNLNSSQNLTIKPQSTCIAIVDQSFGQDASQNQGHQAQEQTMRLQEV